MEKKTVAINLTQDQCRNLADFIEVYLFQEIRDDLEIDNIEWVKDMVDAYALFRIKGKGAEDG